MRNRDINSIAYLFREMDPSEVVEFERSLNENENLLIEVESFRKVHGRLNDLPDLSPPKELTDSVIKIAAQRNSKSGSQWHRTMMFTVAAIMLAGFTAVALITEPAPTTSSGSGQASTGLSTSLQPVGPKSMSGSFEENSATPLKPWVDNDEFIRFSERVGQSESASYDSIFKNSYQRLTPVIETDPYVRMQRRLQLTGSRP